MKKLNTRGFTLIELLIVVVLLFILLTVVATAYSGTQAKNRNAERQADINTLKSQLETYYAQFSKYPTLGNLNDATWRTKNLPDLKTATLQDPSWNKNNKTCANAGAVQVLTQPAADCYTYHVTGSDGADCDNVKNICAQYTLTALFEGGEKYVKSSLN